MGKTIIITGTRKGLGREIAIYYLTKGLTVYGCSRGKDSIVHSNYFHYELDVTDEMKVVKMIREIDHKHNGIDILINNAGIASMNHIALCPTSTANKILQTNFIGSFIFLREVAKIMMKTKKGRVINFSSVATPLNLQGEAIYAASKAALDSLTKIAAKEFGSSGITVNAIGSTPIPTNMIKKVPESLINKLIELQPIKRYAKIDDIINVLDFFIDDKSDFITGQILYLGGVTQ